MTEIIGLIAAMAQESKALLRLIRDAKRITQNPLSAHTFSLSGQLCILVTSGMGARRAGEAARFLVERHSPRLIISFGIAGAVETDLEIGDVVLAEANCRLDNGSPGELLPLAHWSESARQAVAAALAGRGARLFIGTAITTVSSQVQAGQLPGQTHPVLEMETSGIVQVVKSFDIPLLSLRAISDGPRSRIPLDLGQVMDEDANLKVSRLFLAAIRNPKIFLQSRQILRNSTFAAENAALALMAALSTGMVALN